MKFYIAAAMADALEARRLAGHLAQRGHVCTYPWFDLADVGEAWTESKRRIIAEREIEGVRQAHTLILLAPGGRGAHAEFGAALALRKPVILCGQPRFCLFYHHDLVTRLDVSWTDSEIVDALEVKR